MKNSLEYIVITFLQVQIPTYCFLVNMPVCQGCGKSCDTDLCCPNCADFDRSSFFCSQECFGSNWGEHSKLHSILRQQRRMTEMENREKRMRGMSAANDAVNAIRQMISSVTHLDKRTSVSSNSAAMAEEGESQLKGHRLTVVDKVVSGVPSRTGRILIVIFVCLVVLIFAKIHFLISEIPVAVERKVKINDALSVQTGDTGGSGAFVAPVRSAADSVTTHVPSVDDARLIKNLRGEIDGLKSELESYKKIVDELRRAGTGTNSKSNSTETFIEPIKAVVDEIGGVRKEDSQAEISTGPGVVHVQQPSENVRALGQVVGVVREQN